MINFEDFKKLDLRIGTIKKAEEIEDSNKLIKLKVDTGTDVRQLVAGIKKKYSAEDLLERQVVILANLEPKEIFGIESQGMVLAANNGDKIALLSPDKEVENGTEVR